MKLKLNNQLNFVNEWLSINKLCLNVGKSNYVIFSSSQRKIHYSIKIFINLVKIKERKSIKYLGVIIDKNLKWKGHIHELSKKNCQEYWYIIKATAFCPKKHLSVVLLYHLARQIYREYFMVGECVRFLFTSCEGSLNEQVSAANE